jgi:hypothetical protein
MGVTRVRAYVSQAWSQFWYSPRPKALLSVKITLGFYSPLFFYPCDTRKIFNWYPSGIIGEIFLTQGFWKKECPHPHEFHLWWNPIILWIFFKNPQHSHVVLFSKFSKTLNQRFFHFEFFFLKLSVKKGYNKIKEAPNNVKFWAILCVYVWFFDIAIG